LAVAIARPKSVIVGIDISIDMIAVAEAKLRRQNVQNISIMEMDATKLYFKDAEFDAVMVSFGLHEFPGRFLHAVLRETVRVLKPGGTLYITDYDYDGAKGALQRFAFWAYLKAVEPKHMPRFLSMDWHSILGNLGLKVSEIYWCYFSKVIVASAERAAPSQAFPNIKTGPVS